MHQLKVFRGAWSRLVASRAQAKGVRRQLRRRNAGSALLDAIAASFILAIASAAFFSSFPVVDRSQRIAKDETVAGQMGQRMVEQLQLLKTTDLTAGTLTSLNLINTGQVVPPYSFSNIPMDEATMYSPAQALKNGTATLNIQDLANGSKRAIVTISWVSPSGRAQQFVTGTIIGDYK